MRILIATGIYPPESGGPATYSRALAASLVERGNQITVVTYGDAKAESAEAWTVRVISRSGGPLWRYLKYAWRVFFEARTADIVYLQGTVSEGLPATIGAILAGRPTAMRVPGDYAWEIYQQRVKNPELLDAFLQKRHSGRIRWLEHIERWTAKHASSVITPSEYLKRVAMSWGVPESKIHVVLNTVNPLPSGGDPTGVRSVYHLEHATVLLSVARAVPWKGGKFLLRVLKQLPDSYYLVWAGDGPACLEWEAYAKELGIESRVFFLGRVSRNDLASWYHAADIFLLASGYEGYPFVVPEAASAGLPCLVSDKGGNPETKNDFPEYVEVLPYENEEAWLQALQTLPIKKNPAKLRPWSRVVDETFNTLQSVCES